MLKKLRIRVISYAMLAFFLVIVSVSVLVNVINYRMVTSHVDETLYSIQSFENQLFIGSPEVGPEEGLNFIIPSFMGITNPEAQYMMRFFIVLYDNNGNINTIITDNIASVTEENAMELAKVVLEKKRDKGYIGGYRYLKGTGYASNTVVFLNVMQEQQQLRAVAIITLLVASISLVIVSILIVIFSKKAIKPIANNIEKQKQFITDASHELKTPLTSIMTSLDVLSMDNEAGEEGEKREANEWLDNIRSQSERMSKLVGELVMLSRLDEEQPLYAKEKFSVSDIAWEMIEVYQSRAKACERMICPAIEDNICMIGDKSAIQKLLSVLLDNAIKYSKGEGDIEFSVSESRNRIRIIVSNPTELDESIDVNRLFDRFYRPDASRNTSTGGSGIGLAIAKAVVEAHGGEITANCQEGKRLIFMVKI